jgi:hypothetical protein
MKRKIYNFLAFNVGWFACVLAAADGLWMVGPQVMALLMFVHCLLAVRPLREAGFLLFAGLLGTALDSLQMGLGHLVFPGGIWLAGVCPLWMTALWIGFASLFSESLQWLRGRYVPGAVLGAIGGVLAYYGGARMGALELHPDVWRVAPAVAAQYALATPVLLKLSTWWSAGARRPAARERTGDPTLTHRAEA